MTLADSDSPRATRRDWIGLTVLALPCVLYSMDLTVLNLAVPHLTADLAPTSPLLWIVDIYGFLVAGSLITMGTLGDRIGRRRLLLIGAAAFGAASIGAALATTCRDADRGTRRARRRRRNARSVDARLDSQHVPRPAATHHGDRGVGRQLLRGWRHRPAARRSSPRALLVGIRIPAERAGDDPAAGARSGAAAGVPRPEPRPPGIHSAPRSRSSRCSPSSTESNESWQADRWRSQSRRSPPEPRSRPSSCGVSRR